MMPARKAAGMETMAGFSSGKIGLGFFIALIIAPTLPPMPDVGLGSWHGLLILVQQLLIGVAIGFIMRVVFTAVDAAGEIVGLQMGLGFASFFDPHFPEHSRFHVEHGNAEPSCYDTRQRRVGVALHEDPIGLPRLEDFLDRAIQAGEDNVRIIHGVGSGALRRAVHDYLATSPYCAAFREGEGSEGGAGVTVATLQG